MSACGIRRQIFDPDVLDSILLPESGLVPASSEQQLAHDELLGRLTNPQREALEARLSGLSYSRCAEVLGISIRSVRAREDRALAELRRLAVVEPDLFARLAGREVG